MRTVVDLVSRLKTYILGKDTDSREASEQIIAPVESDPSTATHSPGAQLVFNDILYDVIDSIAIGDSLVVGTNIQVADKVSVAIAKKQDQMQLSTMPTASASNVGKVIIYIGPTTSTYTSGQSYQSTLEGGNYIWKPTSISSVDASDVAYDNQTSGLTATDAQAAIDELASQNQTLETALDGKINTSDIVNNLTTSTAGKVLDARQGLALANKHKVTRKTVNTSSWTADSTSQSGSTLYKKSIALSHVYVDSPSVDISTSSGTGLPTTAQQTAYDLLQYVTVDGTTMYLYASAIPSTTFYISIEGVD